MGIMYLYQWYIKLFVYKCRHRSEISNNLEESDAYNIFITHGLNSLEDRDWGREVADYIEEQRIGNRMENITTPQNEEKNNISNETSPLLSTSPLLYDNSQSSTVAAAYSTHRRWKVYCYERQCDIGGDYLENFSKAINTVRYVIVGLSADYLEDRQCQFELDQLKYEMIRRYGRQMKHCIILTTLNNNGELLHKLPKDLNFYNNSQEQPLDWVSNDDASPEWFKIQVFKQLIQVSRSMREY